MKPRNKYEQDICELSSSLRVIPKKRLTKCRNYHTTVYSTTRYSKRYCMKCCNEIPKHKELECPSCGPTIHASKVRWESIYVCYVQSVGDFQVLRYYESVMRYSWWDKPFHTIHEVVRHWIDTRNGKLTTMHVGFKNNMSWDKSWATGHPMEIRLNSNHSSIYAHHVIADSIHPIVMRNGYSGVDCGISDFKVISSILQSGVAETLYKCKQFELLASYINRHIDPSKPNKSTPTPEWWDAFKIAQRRGYTITDSQLWVDYIGMLKRNCKYSVEQFCPDNIQLAHDVLVKKLREKRRRQEKKERMLKMESDGANYKERLSHLFDFVIKSKDGVVIRPLLSIQEFKEHGDILKHCVFENEYYNKQDSLVLGAFVNNTTVENIEVSLKFFKIIHLGGIENEPSIYRSSIKSAVNQNLKEIKSIHKSHLKQISKP